ncbi:hypothetical protein ACHWQZ_G000704 [Mnemiopsis leidyi]
MKIQKWILVVLLLVVLFLDDTVAAREKKKKEKKTDYYIGGKVRRVLEKRSLELEEQGGSVLETRSENLMDTDTSEGWDFN